MAGFNLHIRRSLGAVGCLQATKRASACHLIKSTQAQGSFVPGQQRDCRLRMRIWDACPEGESVKFGIRFPRPSIVWLRNSGIDSLALHGCFRCFVHLPLGAWRWSTAWSAVDGRCCIHTLVICGPTGFAAFLASRGRPRAASWS